ncbi:hypothetical protein OY671_013120, partial [Metschnikowia pulcherrima]
SGRGSGASRGETRREESSIRVSAGAPEGAASPREGGVSSLSVSDIEPDPNQPRRHFDEDASEESARSIAQRGVIQPVIVRPVSAGRYQLVAGERRWRAAQRARVHEIPAIVRKLDEREVVASASIENLQR